MLGSFDEAEDMVQETMLRAWRGRAAFEGRASVKTWLYRIATNACLDHIENRARRLASVESPQAGDPNEIHWIQPYPDRLLDEIASPEMQPDAVVVAKETIELAYLIAIQHLPPRQRAVFVLRDALGLSAKETATTLDDTVASVNSALNRARSLMRNRMAGRGSESRAPAVASPDERKLVERYMAAIDRADVDALASLLREDVRLTMPPFPTWFLGRDEIARDFAVFNDPSSPSYMGPLRTVATASNRQPAVAAYVRGSGESAFRPLGIDVIRVEDDAVVEITRFLNLGPRGDQVHRTDLFVTFGLPSMI